MNKGNFLVYSEGTKGNPTIYLEILVLHHMPHANFLQKRIAVAKVWQKKF